MSAPQPTPTLEPLSRRLLQLAGLLAVLLVVVLANSLLSGSDEKEAAPLEVNPVAAAAAQTQTFAGGRFSLYVVYTAPSIPSR